MFNFRRPPRDFITVARIIKNIVPSEHKLFHLEIDSIINSAKYQAPEVFGALWCRLADSLNNLHEQTKHLPKEDLKWEVFVLSIFTDQKLETIVDI